MPLFGAPNISPPPDEEKPKTLTEPYTAPDRIPTRPLPPPQYTPVAESMQEPPKPNPLGDVIRGILPLLITGIGYKLRNKEGGDDSMLSKMLGHAGAAMGREGAARIQADMEQEYQRNQGTLKRWEEAKDEIMAFDASALHAGAEDETGAATIDTQLLAEFDALRREFVQQVAGENNKSSFGIQKMNQLIARWDAIRGALNWQKQQLENKRALELQKQTARDIAGMGDTPEARMILAGQKGTPAITTEGIMPTSAINPLINKPRELGIREDQGQQKIDISREALELRRQQLEAAAQRAADRGDQARARGLYSLASALITNFATPSMTRDPEAMARLFDLVQQADEAIQENLAMQPPPGAEESNFSDVQGGASGYQRGPRIPAAPLPGLGGPGYTPPPPPAPALDPTRATPSHNPRWRIFENPRK